jgi:hypothetical protein
MSRFRLQRPTMVLIVGFAAVAWLLIRPALLPLVVATAVATLGVKIGFAMLRGLAEPVPEPPPAGELRKVKITYRCSICGTEVRMTTANDQMPEPPRHCLEDMDLVTPVDDL